MKLPVEEYQARTAADLKDWFLLDLNAGPPYKTNWMFEGWLNLQRGAFKVSEAYKMQTLVLKDLKAIQGGWKLETYDTYLHPANRNWLTVSLSFEGEISGSLPIEEVNALLDEVASRAKAKGYVPEIKAGGSQAGAKAWEALGR